MASVRVYINEAAYARLVGPGGKVAQFRQRVGNRVLTNSQRRVNVDTGYLRSTGTTRESSADTTQVLYRARHALFVHNGTRPHLIAARPGHVLRFPGRGGFVFRAAVHHPGYRGNPYLTDALTEEMNRL